MGKNKHILTTKNIKNLIYGYIKINIEIKYSNS